MARPTGADYRNQITEESLLTGLLQADPAWASENRTSRGAFRADMVVRWSTSRVAGDFPRSLSNPKHGVRAGRFEFG